LLLVLASAVILESTSRGTHDQNLFSQIPDYTNLEGQVPVFIYLRNRGGQVITADTGSLFITFYDSQG
jgi:hypothetical protein